MAAHDALLPQLVVSLERLSPSIVRSVNTPGCTSKLSTRRAPLARLIEGLRTLRVMTKAELIAGNRYMVLSTADASGRPWASPVWYAPDGDEGFLWISRPDARHSLNIAERPQIALVIFDSSKPPAERQALYAEAVAKEVGPDPGLVATYSDHSTSQGLGELTVAEVSPPGGEFRLYRAAASEMWILEDDRDQRIPAV